MRDDGGTARLKGQVYDATDYRIDPLRDEFRKVGSGIRKDLSCWDFW